jgi:hypothetical protein
LDIRIRDSEMPKHYTYLAIATPHLGLGFTLSGNEPTSGGSAEVSLPRYAPKRRTADRVFGGVCGAEECRADAAS